MIRRVLVTGASGFVSRALFRSCPSRISLIAASRSPPDVDGIEFRASPELSGAANWKPLLENVDAVIHLAGRVHAPADDQASAYMVENAEGTSKLARDAREAGVGHFIFLSTAKVLGDESSGQALDEKAPARPNDPYSKSKYAAEQALSAHGGPMRSTILRPPLVYGPGVRANFLALLSAVDRGIPLPLASIRNRRSLIGVDNLASAIFACLDSPDAAGRIFHVSDGEPRSTPDLILAIASAMRTPSKLFRFPPNLLEACGRIVGRGDMVKRLTRSLELDDRTIRSVLGWKAPNTFAQGIEDTVRWYQSTSWSG